MSESGFNKGSAIITYRTNNKEAAALVKKIKRCTAGWFFGYWQQIKKYRLEMVLKLMDFFDVDEALLVRFTEFNPATLTLRTGLGDVDKQLERVKTNLGINQGWYADLEDKETGNHVDMVSHCKALEMTLRNQIEVVDNADRSGPSRWSEEAASNYCGELLGTVITLLILRASSHNLTRPLPAITLFQDNRGGLSHGNNPYTALPEKQKQADLICLIKLLSASSKITLTWEWVEGHAVERKGLQGSTLPKRYNDQANKLV